MDRFKAMQTFAQVATTGSFAKAAQLLGMSRGSISKHVTELEQHLGVNLLNRNTRHVSLTEAGRRFFADCGKILHDLDSAEHAAAGTQQSLSGSLKVIAKRTFGALHLSSAVADFAASYQDIELCLVLDDQFSDMPALVEDSFDVAIRISPLADSSMAARKLTVLRWIPCAAPEYLKARGIPRHPRDLAKHNCLYQLHQLLPSKGSTWHFKGDKGDVSVRVTGAPFANNVLCLRAAALKGLGVAILPTYCIGEDLAAGRLIPILQRFRVETRALYAIYRPGGRLPQKVGKFVQFLLDRYRDPPWDIAWRTKPTATEPVAVARSGN